jgi:hypothetical protein
MWFKTKKAKRLAAEKLCCNKSYNKSKMKKLLLLTFLFTSFLCEAQQKTPIIEWQKTIGGSSYETLKEIQPTKDGGYILGGSSNNPISSNNYWVIKMNAIGNIEWQRLIGGKDNDVLESIQQTSDGGYILGGYSNSIVSLDKTEKACNLTNQWVPYYDYWIVKLDSVGNIKWQNSICASHDDYLHSIKQTFDGGYILGGITSSGIYYDKTVPFIGGENDFWVIKVDSIGNIQWQKEFGGDSTDILTCMQQTNDSGYILGGYSNSNNSNTKKGKRGSYDYWVIKLNSIGEITWQKVIGGSVAESLESIQQTTDGGYILGGESYSNISGDKTENSYGYTDCWVVKLNDTGTIEWQKTIGGNEGEYLNSIRQTYDSGYILGGTSYSNISGNKTDNSFGNDDYWVVKLNDLGTIEWQKTIGGSSKDLLNSINQTKDSAYILGGYSFSNISGEKTENSYGNSDYWVVKFKMILVDSIKGVVFKELNNNCTQEPNENGIQNIVLKTEPKIFFGISDTLGKYTILTDTGTYKVKPIYSRLLNPFNQQTVCPTIGYHTVSFSQYGHDTSEINFANYEKQCAYLQVELSQGRMRRCFENTTTIKYCNIGNVDTTNVQVVVTLPEYVTFVSASNTNYTISGKKITFNIGTLRANECGTINLITNVDCVNGITGLTQCISAYILPRNKCVDQIQPDYALWDKSEVSVDGRCTGNTARFVIKNMLVKIAWPILQSYRIYKDAVQALSSDVLN